MDKHIKLVGNCCSEFLAILCNVKISRMIAYLKIRSGEAGWLFFCFLNRGGKKTFGKGDSFSRCNGCGRWWVSSCLPIKILLHVTSVGKSVLISILWNFVLGFSGAIANPCHRCGVYWFSFPSVNCTGAVHALLANICLSGACLVDIHWWLRDLRVSRCSAATVLCP